MKINTQNTKIEDIIEITFVLGSYVGSEAYYARVFDYKGFEYSKNPFQFSNIEEKFVILKAWILDIKEK